MCQTWLTSSFIWNGRLWTWVYLLFPVWIELWTSSCDMWTTCTTLLYYVLTLDWGKTLDDFIIIFPSRCWTLKLVLLLFVSIALPTSTLTVDPHSPVHTGETVTLKCHVSEASYSGWTYKWYTASSSEPIFHSVKDTYTIKAISESWQGLYWCQGQRTERPTSTERSNEVNVEVTGEYVHHVKGVTDLM